MRHFYFLSLLLIMFCSFSVIAENNENSDLPQSGQLAGVSMGGTHGVTGKGLWAGDTSKGGSTAPIGASMRRDGNNWKVTVQNRSEDQYTANIKFVQQDANGRQLRQDPFTVTLRANQSLERTFRAFPTVANASVELVRWTVKKKEPEETELEEVSAEDAESTSSAPAGISAR